MSISIKVNSQVAFIFILTVSLLTGMEEREDKTEREADKLLIEAARSGSAEKINEALNKGANINFRSKIAKRTALHFAALKGYSNIVEMLINKGADINQRDLKGWLPIHCAAYEGCQSAVERLMSKGAEQYRAVDDDGNIPLALAAKAGRLKEAKQRKNIEVEKKYLDVVKFFVDKETERSKQNKPSWTALHQNADEGFIEGVRALIEAGEDVNVQDIDGKTPFVIAAEKGKQAVCKELVSGGARVPPALSFVLEHFEAMSNDRWTPLHQNAADGLHDKVRSLMEAGEDVNVQDIDGRTPLHVAAEKGRLNIVEQLLRSEVIRVDARTKKGLTALELAQENNQSDVVRYLKDHIYEVNPKIIKLLFEQTKGNQDLALINAVEIGFLQWVKFFIGLCADVNTRNKRKETPLHLAASQGYEEIVNALIEAKALLDEQERGGKTPLYLAAGAAHTKIVKVLLLAGARIEIADTDGDTPLHMAALRGHTAVVKLLVEALKENQVSLDIPNKEGLTPLHWAAQKEQWEVIKLLISEGASDQIRAYNGKTPLEMALEYGRGVRQHLQQEMLLGEVDVNSVLI